MTWLDRAKVSYQWSAVSGQWSAYLLRPTAEGSFPIPCSQIRCSLSINIALYF
ncbi:MAG: hypothetical protein F6J94_15085 [Moorea sp. SIO1F2]|uniref:hypothetical protein n=1 Tax=unclassified Moorena TaxID=2683338 RepID=UPI0013BA8480|nr:MULTISPECIES: hypothetical protein [unclassified Moorena]NEO04251.1 hypothetical protein [Moorena sp. SIO3I8]NEO25136.1 hypothetical protein [Moorena sp. SIO4A5]NEP26419.1 hypothetical protein [Moorena sp. SIO3I6]NET83201.1 hypothetical protein [Moorena sp. SIO1F2]